MTSGSTAFWNTLELTKTSSVCNAWYVFVDAMKLNLSQTIWYFLDINLLYHKQSFLGICKSFLFGSANFFHL